MPRPGQVLGLVGTNGIGKPTALKILVGKMKPNLGRYDSPPDWEEILVHFRGSDLQNYFTKILEDSIKATNKPQYQDGEWEGGEEGGMEGVEGDNRDANAADATKRWGLDGCLCAPRAAPPSPRGPPAR